ncbi:MAG: chromosomal replication initiator protein DnaA [Candidatus Sungbacteria bacterium]|uniref:Chromosomal replication initiator protein DnaA n=1 Tax=Candidatus Sungiibacteriota bacterium TaxID=2750080 RepID=A0A933DRB0_9BACT|nr:chromosomal replication initiator protein DnaA [Candidatus Sungbacteria bacterium]
MPPPNEPVRANSLLDRAEVWKSVLAEIELTTSRASFVTWFQETAIADIADGVVTVSVPNGFAKNWLQDKYHRVILRCLRNLLVETRDVNYVVGALDRPAAARPKARLNPRPAFLEPQERLELREGAADPESGLNPRYLFESFVVGSFNELAAVAAQAVVKNPGLTYNPLFIYGGVGLGKTHLIQAIGNEVLKQRPEAKVRYVPSEKFMGEIVDAINTKTMNQLKERYRSVDLLIMDDIQFIARTEKMQEEFFYAFNALYERNKQIIISSDKPPAAIPTLEQRLRSRFEGGMIADIGEPDFETRLAILKSKLKGKNLTLPDDVLEYVARTVKSNIRELEGALNRLLLRTTMAAAPPDVEETKRILSQVSGAPRRFISPKKIIRTVAEFYDVTEKDIINRSRRKEIVKPRQIAMYLLREELKCSFPFIGEKLGKKDHTTAIHAYKKITADLIAHPELDGELKTLKEKIYTPPV